MGPNNPPTSMPMLIAREVSPKLQPRSSLMGLKKAQKLLRAPAEMRTMKKQTATNTQP